MKFNIKRRKPDKREQLMDALIAEMNKVVPIHAHSLASLKRLTPAQLKPALPPLEKALTQPIGLGNRVAICEVIAEWAKGGIAIPLKQFPRTLPRIDNDYVECRAFDIAQIIADTTTARDKQFFDDIAELTQDTRYRGARIPLPQALAQIKSRREDAIRIFIQGLEQKDDIAQFLIEALRKMKASEAAEAVAPYLQSSNPDVRVEARKALRVFGVIVEAPKSIGIKVTRKKLRWETSVSFDPEDILELLGMVDEELDAEGLSSREIAAIHQAYEEQEEDQVQRFEFRLTYQEQEVRVRFEMIDGDELYIFSDSKDLIAAIERRIDERFV